MAFTLNNTNGYTTDELDALNDELAAILAEIPEDDISERYQAEQAFADEVGNR